MFWTGHSWDCFWGGSSPEADIDTPVPPFDGYTGDGNNNDIRVFYKHKDEKPVSLDEVSKNPGSYYMHVSGHNGHPAFNGRFKPDGHENGKPKWRSESNHGYKMFWTGHSWDCYFGGYSPEAPIDTPVPPFEGYTGDQGNCDIRVYYELIREKKGGMHWTEHSNIDMSGQGDKELIGSWTSKYSIEELKKYCEEKGYTAISVSPGNKHFDFAALKQFSYQLKPEHCHATGHYENTFYILNSGDQPSKEQAKKKGGSKGKRQEQPQPIDVEFADGGIWTTYENIDMCGQGDVEIIGEWEQKHSIEDLKKMVIKKGYSAISVSPNSESYGHAALKKFSYNLTPMHCKPRAYKCHLYIFNSFGSSDGQSSAIGSKLTLVKRGSSQQAIFEDIESLKEGKVVKSKLSSHGGKVALGRQYKEERRHDVWRYIESQCVSENDDDALYLKYVDDSFLMLVNMDLVLDVAFWQMHEGNVVNYVGSGAEHEQTKQGGGGRDWTLNSDGTISAKHHPHLVLGF